MSDKSGHGASCRIEFDGTVFAEDLTQASPAGRRAGELKRTDVERDGQRTGELIACDPEARDGTKLPGCFKTYVPWPTGRWGMVFELRIGGDHRPYLALLAFGARHHPKGSNAQTVYDIADKRLNG